MHLAESINKIVLGKGNLSSMLLPAVASTCIIWKKGITTILNRLRMQQWVYVVYLVKWIAESV